METPPKDTNKKQVCTIRIMFQVDADEEAIDCKKKVEAALGDNTEARFEFGLMTMPSRPMG